MSPAEVQALGDKIRATVDTDDGPDPALALELLIGMAVNLARIAENTTSKKFRNRLFPEEKT